MSPSTKLRQRASLITPKRVTPVTAVPGWFTNTAHLLLPAAASTNGWPIPPLLYHRPKRPPSCIPTPLRTMHE